MSTLNMQHVYIIIPLLIGLGWGYTHAISAGVGTWWIVGTAVIGAVIGGLIGACLYSMSKGQEGGWIVLGAIIGGFWGHGYTAWYWTIVGIVIGAIIGAVIYTILDHSGHAPGR